MKMDVLIWGRGKVIDKIMNGGGHKTGRYFRLY